MIVIGEGICRLEENPFLEFLHQQQSYMMPRLDLMTANNPKMDR